jgi:ssDNA-binding Zn-finger/Zn-ribbon topoisomerase 1
VIGESVNIPFTLINNGNTQTLPGEVRVVRNSDWMILDTIPTYSINPGGSFSGEFTIEEWPDSKVVDVHIIWLTSGVTESLLLEIETYSDNNAEAELPFDIMAAIYGTVTGLVLVMFILVMYRTVSESVEDTGKSRFNRIREARGEKKKSAAVQKREIPCPECDQRLHIPNSHSGAVKCPACTSRFIVDPIPSDGVGSIPEEDISENQSESHMLQLPKQISARSMDDLLSCPSCHQTLKIPINKRPVKARCPACRSEFLAEFGDA